MPAGEKTSVLPSPEGSSRLISPETVPPPSPPSFSASPLAKKRGKCTPKQAARKGNNSTPQHSQSRSSPGPSLNTLNAIPFVPSLVTMASATAMSLTSFPALCAPPCTPLSSFEIPAHLDIGTPPLEQLHYERLYLEQSLRKQDECASRLFERYAAIEARLAAFTVAGLGKCPNTEGNSDTAVPDPGNGVTAEKTRMSSSETKKLRNYAAYLKAKIAETIKQQQMIWLRLGEITLELENRARWPQAWNSYRHQPRYQFEQQGMSTIVGSHLTRIGVYPYGSFDGGVGMGFGFGVGIWLRIYPPQQSQPEASTQTPISTQPALPPPPSPTLSTAIIREPRVTETEFTSILSPSSPCFIPRGSQPNGVVFPEDIWARTSTSRTTSSLAAVDGSAGEASSGCGSFVGCAGKEGKKGDESWAEEVEGRQSEMGDDNACDHGNETVLVEKAIATTRAMKASTKDDDDHTSRQEDQRKGLHFHTQEKCKGDGQTVADSEGEDEYGDSPGLKEGMRRVSLYLPSSLKGREKRMSLPYVKSLWPRSRRGSGQGSGQE